MTESLLISNLLTFVFSFSLFFCTIRLSGLKDIPISNYPEDVTIISIGKVAYILSYVVVFAFIILNILKGFYIPVIVVVASRILSILSIRALIINNKITHDPLEIPVKELKLYSLVAGASIIGLILMSVRIY